MLKVLDLFSGIGGFSYGLESTSGFETIAFCEIDPFCRKVLAKHWPSIPIHIDIKKLRKESLDGRTVDVICGGFPCQPFSVSGQRLGKADDRDLWPEMFRVVQEFQPRWVIGENVAGFIKMELDRTIADLESIGYAVQTFIIPACAVNAPHRRDRCWIIAHPSLNRGNQICEVDRIYNATAAAPQTFNAAGTNQIAAHINCERQQQPQRIDQNIGGRVGDGNKNFADAYGIGLQRCNVEPVKAESNQRRDRILPGWNEDWPTVVRRLCRVDDGLSRELDRRRRIKALGNSVVPQVVYEIGMAILETERMSNDNMA